MGVDYQVSEPFPESQPLRAMGLGRRLVLSRWAQEAERLVDSRHQRVTVPQAEIENDNAEQDKANRSTYSP